MAAQGRFENAEPLLLAGYAGVEAGRGRDDRRTREVADQLVRLYEDGGWPEEAEKYRFETGAEQILLRGVAFVPDQVLSL